ncbi:MAG: glycosyltransferase family 4 protein [Candidatus Aegiribacteria sp.]|nr:glycosyltransferase family 4 protein [Candidatus Aegiribacteria sp.]
MKILIDARALQEHVDGISRYSLGVLKALMREKPGWDCSVLINRNAVTHLENLNMEYLLSDVRRFSRGENKHLNGFIDSIGADIYLNLSMAGPCPETPTVITVHDLIVLNQPGYFGNSLIRNILSRMIFRKKLKQSIRHADAVSVPSRVTLRILDETFPGSGDKSFVTGEGQHLFSSGNGTVPDSPREDFLLYVGNARAYKNLTRLVVAYSRLKAINPDFPKIIMVVRKDRAFRNFMRDVEDCSATDSITVLSHISDTELKEFYSKCIGLIMPSLQEGFGLPALEAMASGAPVVVSSGTALEELVGSAGILVDPESVTDIMHGMALLASQPELRKDLSEKAVVRAGEFSWCRTARILTDKLEEIVSNGMKRHLSQDN